MTVRELRERLAHLDQDCQVMVLDGFNGGGTPRDLNLGPSERVITRNDGRMSGDCEGRLGEHIYVIGYGCY